VALIPRHRPGNRDVIPPARLQPGAAADGVRVAVARVEHESPPKVSHAELVSLAALHVLDKDVPFGATPHVYVRLKPEG